MSRGRLSAEDIRRISRARFKQATQSQQFRLNLSPLQRRLLAVEEYEPLFSLNHSHQERQALIALENKGLLFSVDGILQRTAIGAHTLSQLIEGGWYA